MDSDNGAYSLKVDDDSGMLIVQDTTLEEPVWTAEHEGTAHLDGLFFKVELTRQTLLNTERAA